jgi:hypothetical protein
LQFATQGGISGQAAIQGLVGLFVRLAVLGGVEDVQYRQLGVVLLCQLGGATQGHVSGVAQVMGNEDVHKHETNLRPMDVGDLLSIKQ